MSSDKEIAKRHIVVLLPKGQAHVVYKRIHGTYSPKFKLLMMLDRWNIRPSKEDIYKARWEPTALNNLMSFIESLLFINITFKS